MTTSLGTATLDLRVTTRNAINAVKTGVDTMLTELKKVNRDITVSVKVNTARAVADAQKAKRELQDSFRDALKLNVTGLSLLAREVKTISNDFSRTAGELKDAANKLKLARQGTGGAGGGGGGSPGSAGGAGGVGNAYSAQLRALQGDLRSGAATTGQFETATRALKNSIDAEIASLRSLGVLTREQQNKLNSLRATSGQAGQALKQLGDQATRAADQAAKAAAKAAADAARASQKAAQDAARAQSEGVNRLARDLQLVQSQYQRGAVGLREYLREMGRIQTAGQGMASSLQAGSRDAQNLERVMSGLSRNTAKINDQSIAKLRSDLAGARAEFERATAAAGRFNFTGQRAATQAYQTELQKLEQRIRSVGERSTATQAQIRSLNQLSATLGSQRNAMQGTFTPVGLAGNVTNALKSLPQFADQMGGSLGAAFAPAQQLTGGLERLAAAAGPVGIAIGAVTLAAGALAVGLVKAIGTASQFQQTLTDIKALTQPTTADMRQLTQATFDIGKPLGVGARDAAAAVLELNKAGLSAKDVIGGGLKGALELAGAAGVQTAEASGMVVSAMTAFGLQANNIPKIADVFANFANKTTLGASDLSQAIAAVGPVARDAGIGIEQFSGLMATLAQGGFKNMSDAGTSLKTMLLALSAPSETASKALGALKVSAFDSKGMMRPLTDTLSDLKAKLVQLTPEAQKQLLKQIFGTDAIRAAQILLREGTAKIQENTKAMQLQGEAARVARERMDSLQGAQKKFAAVMEQVRIVIGTPFLKPLQSIVEWATKGAEAFLHMGQQGQKGMGAFASLAAAAQQGMAPLGQMLAALGTGIAAVWNNILKPVLTSLWQIWSVVQTAVRTALGIVLRVAQGVFVAVGGVVQGFVQAFGGHGKSVNFTLAGMAAKITEWSGIARTYILAVGKIAATLIPVFQGVGVGLGQIIAGIVKTLGGLATGAAAVFKAAGGYALAFLTVLGRFGAGIGQIIKGSGQILGAFALAVKNAVVDRVQTVFASSVQLFGRFADGVGSLLKPVQAIFNTYIVEPLQAAGRFVESGLTFVANTIGAAAQKVGQLLAPVGKALSALGSGLGDTLQGIASNVSAGLQRVVGQGAAEADRAAKAAQLTANRQAQASATNAANIVTSSLKGAAQGANDFVKDNGGAALLTQGTQTLTAGLKTATTASQGLNASLSGTTRGLQAGLNQAGASIRGASKDYQAGAATIAASVSGVGATVKTAMATTNAELAKAKTNAVATAQAVKTATGASPAAAVSGNKTLADIGLGGKKKAPAVTASDLVEMDRYKKALDGMSEAELKTRLAAAQANNEKDKTRALLAELNSRQREHTASLKLTGIALDKYKEALRGKSPEQLKDLLATAESTKNNAAYAAVKAEMARREKAHADSLKITGTELVKFKDALKGKSDQQLKDLLVTDRVKATASAMSAVIAEQTRRQNAEQAAQKKAAAAAKVAADQRANLVREMRQSISVFALADKQNKVTEASQLAFRNRMEDFRAQVGKLPAALQKGTEALFDQSKALLESSTAHMKVSGTIKLAGAALGEYKDSVKAMSDEVLAGSLEDEKRNGNLQKQTILYAEISRRAGVKAAADKAAAAEAQRHADAAADLELRTKHLNEDFALQVKQGKVTAESLQNYQQALDNTRAKVEELPEAYRANTLALVGNGAALVTAGQGVVDHKTQVDALKQSVDGLTYAELQNLALHEKDPEKLKIIQAQIDKFKTLSDAQADAAHAESLLSQAGANRSGLEGEFEARKSAAQGNLAEIYRLTLEYGDKIRVAQDADADAQAARDVTATRKKFGDLLALAGISDEKRRQLETDRDRELGAIETTRLNAHAANLASMNNAELEAKTSLDEAIKGIDRSTRDAIRKNNLDLLAKLTSDAEAQQADELDAEDLTEQQKLAIRERNRPLLLAAKHKEVAESRAIDLQAEDDRFNDEVAATQKKLGTTQAFLNAKVKLEEAHRVNVAGINKKYDDDERDYGLALQREVAKAKASAFKADSSAALADAKDVVEKQLSNLDEQTAANRKAARDTLNIWRNTYTGMGEAGKKALAEIEDAIEKLDAADKKAIKLAGRSIVAPADIKSNVSSKLARIAKPENAEAVSEAAIAKYDELLTSLRDKLKVTELELEDFKNVSDASLTPNERAAKAGLEATAAAYQKGIDTVKAAATAAGTAATNAYTQAQKDTAAESTLALAEINYELAQQEGRDGGPAYLAGLQSAIAYWKGRLEGLDKGADDYLKQQADILKKIGDLEKKSKDLNTNPWIARIETISQAVGTGGTLQKGIKAGLDGLAAYLKAGGSKDGAGSVIAAASALVGGLAEVFKTGDEDTDKVVDTFVSGIQGVLGSLAKGDWIGAAIAGVTTLVTTLVDILQGGANSAKKAAQQISDATKSIKIFDTSKYAKVVSRGGFWGWLGFKKSEIDQDSLDIAQSFGDAIYSSISTGMMNGFKAGKVDSAAIVKDLKSSLTTMVVQGLIDGFLKSAAIQELFQPMLDAYIAAWKAGNQQGMMDAISSMDTLLDSLGGQIETFTAGLKPLTDRLVEPDSTGAAVNDLGSQLKEAVFGGISSGMLAGIKAGKMKFSELGLDVKAMLGEQILQGIINAFLQGEVFKAKLSPLIEQWINAKPGDRVSIAGQIQSVITDIGSGLSDLYENVLIPAGNNLGLFNSDNLNKGSKDITFGGGGSSSSSMATVSTEITNGSLTVMADALTVGSTTLRAATDTFGTFVTGFGGHVDRFGQHVDRLGGYLNGAGGTNWPKYNQMSN